jgi:hypothetical protein
MKRLLRTSLFSALFAPIAAVILCTTLTALGAAAQEQKQDNGESKHFDVQSSVGDLHVGNDADARKAGLPLYPGARLRHDEKDNESANLSLFTDAFGVKLVVAKYETDDAPAKVIDFYRDKLKKYGKVLECHAHGHAGSYADFDDDDKDDKDQKPKPLQCEGDNSGPVTELKAGTQNNQHVVAVEPKEGHGGATFAIVYVHARGKEGEI